MRSYATHWGPCIVADRLSEARLCCGCSWWAVNGGGRLVMRQGTCGAELEVATSGRVGNDACTYIRHPGGCCRSVVARALPQVYSARAMCVARAPRGSFQPWPRHGACNGRRMRRRCCLRVRRAGASAGAPAPYYSVSNCCVLFAPRLGRGRRRRAMCGRYRH